VFHGQTDAMKARTKTTIVALDRAMLEMVKELRFSGRRPTARLAEEAPFEAAVQVRPPGPPPPSVDEQVAAETPASVIVAAEPVMVAAPNPASGQGIWDAGRVTAGEDRTGGREVRAALIPRGDRRASGCTPGGSPDGR
jgi:hypothetical protein